MTTVTFEIHAESGLISASLEDLGFTEAEWAEASDSDKEEAIFEYMEDENLSMEIRNLTEHP